MPSPSAFRSPTGDSSEPPGTRGPGRRHVPPSGVRRSGPPSPPCSAPTPRRAGRSRRPRAGVLRHGRRPAHRAVAGRRPGRLRRRHAGRPAVSRPPVVDLERLSPPCGGPPSRPAQGSTRGSAPPSPAGHLESAVAGGATARPHRPVGRRSCRARSLRGGGGPGPAGGRGAGGARARPPRRVPGPRAARRPSTTRGCWPSSATGGAASPPSAGSPWPRRWSARRRAGLGRPLPLGLDRRRFGLGWPARPSRRRAGHTPRSGPGRGRAALPAMTALGAGEGPATVSSGPPEGSFGVSAGGPPRLCSMSRRCPPVTDDRSDRGPHDQ